MDLEELVKSRVRDVKDYPKRGTVFRDMTPLLADGPAFSSVIDALAARLPAETDVVAGIESRGFIIGGALAHRMGTGFVPIRKGGKLPCRTVGVDYELEYGRAEMEVHEDALSGKRNVAVVDDLLATGGTAEAAGTLVRRLHGRVLAFAFVMELAGLGGRRRLGGVEAISLARY